MVNVNIDSTPQEILLATVIDPNITPSFNTMTTGVNNQYQSILSGQNDIASMLANEQSRLNTKQQSVNLAKTSQDRMIQLNQSYSEKYAAYSGIMLSVILGLIVMVIVAYLGATFGIPEGIVTLLYIVIIAVTILRAFFMYTSILARDPLYFDQLALAPPDTKGTAATSSIVASGADGADLLSGSTVDGSQFCNPDTNSLSTWNTATMLCDGFQNMEGFTDILSPSTRFYSDPKMVTRNQVVPFEIEENGMPYTSMKI